MSEKIINRRVMRGERLETACRKARISRREYAIGDYVFNGCYGTHDYPYFNDAECASCGAYVCGDFVKRAHEVIQ